MIHTILEGVMVVILLFIAVTIAVQYWRDRP